jgi:hypothetical protein
MTTNLQCADVHAIGNAHSHIARNSAHYPAQCKSKGSLKALSAKVLHRTLPRTFPAHCEITPRTLPAHCTPEIDPPRTLQKEVDPGRTWEPGNPFVCDRGFSTGWLRDGKPLCPACDGKHPALNDEPAAVLPGTRANISPVALSWLAENKVQLRRHGWTMAELYRRNISPGIAFSPIWEKPFLKATLLDSGAIEFEFIDGGKDCINKAYPMPQRQTKSKEKNIL